MYVEKSDIEKEIPSEHLKVISRDNDENITTAIEDAISEVEAFISVRYNSDEEFAKTGSNRNTFVVKLVKNIAVYNLYTSSNRVNMPESATNNYNSTIKTLKEIQAERAQLKGLTRLTDADGTSSYLKFGGNTPRKNHF